MKQDRIALLKAIHSGDTDMVHHVLLHLRHTLPPGDFFHLLDDANDPQVAPALALLQVYAKQADRQLLRDFYYQDDRRVETACLEWMEAGETGSVEERLKGLKGAAKAFGEDKERSFEAKVCFCFLHRMCELALFGTTVYLDMLVPLDGRAVLLRVAGLDIKVNLSGGSVDTENLGLVSLTLRQADE